MKSILQKHDHKSIGLIGHTIIDYPSPEQAREVINIMVAEGVSLIELQIPFSEPVADGPLFLQANHEAIDAGVTVEQCFEFVQEVSNIHSTPFVLMTYANILYKRGFENFVKAAKQAGAKGAIVPDLPVEIAQEYLSLCKQYDFASIPLLPPNMKEARMQQLLEVGNGFVYAVARKGVTGSKTNFGVELTEFITKIRHYSDLPIAVGFGVATPEDVAFLKPYADYAIVGTQALHVLQTEGIQGLQRFWRSLSRAAAVAEK